MGRLEETIVEKIAVAGGGRSERHGTRLMIRRVFGNDRPELYHAWGKGIPG